MSATSVRVCAWMSVNFQSATRSGATGFYSSLRFHSGSKIKSTKKTEWVAASCSAKYCMIHSVASITDAVSSSKQHLSLFATALSQPHTMGYSHWATQILYLHRTGMKKKKGNQSPTDGHNPKAVKFVAHIWFGPLREGWAAGMWNVHHIWPKHTWHLSSCAVWP